MKYFITDLESGEAREVTLEKYADWQEQQIKELKVELKEVADNELAFCQDAAKKEQQIKELKNQQLRWHKAATNEEDSLKQQIKELKESLLEEINKVIAFDKEIKKLKGVRIGKMTATEKKEVRRRAMGILHTYGAEKLSDRKAKKKYWFRAVKYIMEYESQSS